MINNTTRIKKNVNCAVISNPNWIRGELFYCGVEREGGEREIGGEKREKRM